jgi:hypothetical protein
MAARAVHVAALATGAKSFRDNPVIGSPSLNRAARGASARPSARAEIWAYGRRNLLSPWLGLDPAALPMIKGRAIPLHWTAMDLWETFNLGRNPWRCAGILTPLSPPHRSTGGV